MCFFRGFVVGGGCFWAEQGFFGSAEGVGPRIGEYIDGGAAGECIHGMKISSGDRTVCGLWQHRKKEKKFRCSP